jgi:hypothetical protein
VTTRTLPLDKVQDAVTRYTAWLDRYGETSYDKESYFAGPLGRRSKALYYSKPFLGTMAVAPMVFSEAFAPTARRLFWKRQRFPIADAHYAMGFAFLFEALGDEAYYRRAVHFLEVLEATRCPRYGHHAWGYPFDWVTRNAQRPAGIAPCESDKRRPEDPRTRADEINPRQAAESSVMTARVEPRLVHDFGNPSASQIAENQTRVLRQTHQQSAYPILPPIAVVLTMTP